MPKIHFTDTNIRQLKNGPTSWYSHAALLQKSAGIPLAA